MKTTITERGVLLTPETEAEEAYLFRLVTAPDKAEAETPDETPRKTHKSRASKPRAARIPVPAPKKHARTGGLRDRIRALFTDERPEWGVAEMMLALGEKTMANVSYHLPKIADIARVRKGVYRLAGAPVPTAEPDTETPVGDVGGEVASDGFERLTAKFLRAHDHMVKTQSIVDHLRAKGFRVAADTLIMGLRSIEGVKAYPNGYWKWEGE